MVDSTPTVISQDPKSIVSLSRVHLLVNEFFDLDADDAVSLETPFVWWDRSKRNDEIALPMPEPVSYSSVSNRGPLWNQEQILHWFGQWRDIDVRVCLEAGDRTSARGRVISSPCRE